MVALICWLCEKKVLIEFTGSRGQIFSPVIVREWGGRRRWKNNLQTSCYAPRWSSRPCPRWTWRRRPRDCGREAQNLHGDTEREELRLRFQMFLDVSTPQTHTHSQPLPIPRKKAKGSNKCPWNSSCSELSPPLPSDASYIGSKRGRLDVLAQIFCAGKKLKHEMFHFKMLHNCCWHNKTANIQC